MRCAAFFIFVNASNFGPHYQQESKEKKHGAICNINHIYKEITLTHYLFYFGSVKYAGYPEDDADHQSEEHQHYT